MSQITKAWVVDEATTGDHLRIGYVEDGKEKFGKLTGTAFRVLEIKGGSADGFERVLLQAVQRYVDRHPHDEVVIMNPVDLG